MRLSSLNGARSRCLQMKLLCLISYDSLAPTTPEASSEVKSLLDKLMVLKLNGNLETTMGCTGPKYAESDFIILLVYCNYLYFFMLSLDAEFSVCNYLVTGSCFFDTYHND
ncbi:hypothetical protein S83_065275 [Arachis hypogaea]